MDYAALAKVLHEIMPDSVSEVERYLTCFSCFRYLKNIIEKKGWKYPHAAYANNLAALSRLYDVAFKYDFRDELIGDIVAVNLALLDET